METDYNPMELSSVSGFEEDGALNGVEGSHHTGSRLQKLKVATLPLTHLFFFSLTAPGQLPLPGNTPAASLSSLLKLSVPGPPSVVGYAFDHVDHDLQTPYHETVYSLLDTLMPWHVGTLATQQGSSGASPLTPKALQRLGRMRPASKEQRLPSSLDQLEQRLAWHTCPPLAPPCPALSCPVSSP
ncbi:PREDICTED: GSK3-beta interaction protein [Chrysochloris asiatica]|uniref:GSK3-beta interaction protein n=1 Tax=Chrysochloris asiatica TaxID=185453 RepID=A0A9B0WK92_CHRAS|nr:PREDICTED: GSK3-beta interaction protein [Chrysochloris asiatica]